MNITISDHGRISRGAEQTATGREGNLNREGTRMDAKVF